MASTVFSLILRIGLPESRFGAVISASAGFLLAVGLASTRRDYVRSSGAAIVPLLIGVSTLDLLIVGGVDAPARASA